MNIKLGALALVIIAVVVVALVFVVKWAVYNDSSTPIAATEETTVVEETAPIEETTAIEETVPTEEPTPTMQATPTEEPAPMETPAIEEIPPTEELAPTEEPTPLPAHVIADACEGMQEAESVTITKLFYPVAETEVVTTLKFTPTGGRSYTSFDGIPRRERSLDLWLGLNRARILFQIMQDAHNRGGQNDKWDEWTGELFRKNSLPPELPVADSFCGFAPDELVDLRYIGTETVDGINTRHYSAILDGDLLEMWIDFDGFPVQYKTTFANGDSGYIATYSDWNGPKAAPIVFSTDPPTSVVANACDEADLSAFGTISQRAEPDPNGMLMTLEFTETAIRHRLYNPQLRDDGGPAFEQVIILDTPVGSAGETVYYMDYKRMFNGVEMTEWTVEEKDTPNEIPDSAFCGFTADDLTDLRYVGEQMVEGVNARYYTAILEPDGYPWEMWVGPNGPVKISIVADDEFSEVLTFTYERPNITVPVQETEETTTTGSTPTPVPSPAPDDTPTPIPANTSTPVPTATSIPSATDA